MATADEFAKYPTAEWENGIAKLIHGTARVASVLVADRYIRVMYADATAHGNKNQIGRLDAHLTDFRQLPDPLQEDHERKIDFDYPDYSSESLKAVFKRALQTLKVVCKGIKVQSLTIGCCLGLDSSLAVDRFNVNNIPADHRRAYGRISANSIHPDWAGVNLYKEAVEEFSGISRYVYVHPDVNLAAMAVYYHRVQTHWSDEFQKKFQIAPEIHSAKFKGFGEKDEWLRHSTLAYVKLSAEINMAVVKDGNLLSGMNHLGLNALQPRPYMRISEKKNAQGKIVSVGEIDTFNDCQKHIQCFSGLLSERALVRWLGLEDEVYSYERVVRQINLNDHPKKEQFKERLYYYVSQIVRHIMGAHDPTTIIFGGRLIEDTDGLWPKLHIPWEVSKIIGKHIDKNTGTYPNADYFNLRDANEDSFEYLQAERAQRSAPRGGCILSVKALCQGYDRSIRLEEKELGNEPVAELPNA